MATAHRVGGEVDAFCTKCRLTLAHTILAMVGTKIARVRCNTCGGEHALRSAPGSKATAKPRSRAASADRPTRAVISFEQRLSERDVGSAKTYSPKTSYVVDELISHPTFGLGIVTAVRLDKIDVDFKTAQKTLVHGRGEAGPQQPTFTHPEARNVGPSDKQPTESSEPAAATAAPAAETGPDSETEQEPEQESETADEVEQPE